MDRPYPPTIIVVHAKERRSKCSVEPLRGHPDFQFFRFPFTQRPPVVGYVRLGLGGPLLSTADATSGLLVLDATWKLAENMEQEFQDVPVRSLPELQTAYPRTSKLYQDPCQGLATIEAIYAAYAILGRPTTGLLEHYRWADDFLTINAPLLQNTNRAT